MSPGEKIKLEFEALQKKRFRKRAQRDIFFYHWRTRCAYVSEWVKEVLDTHIPAGAGSVLELGCGDGAIAQYFKSCRRGLRYFGIDRAEERLQFAQGGFSEGNFLASDVRKLPFASNSFDAVFCYGVFHHLKVSDFDTVFSEMVRVARPGGVVFFLEPNGRSFFFWLLGFLRKVERGIWNIKEEKCRQVIQSQGQCREAQILYEDTFVPFHVLTQVFYWIPFVRGQKAAQLLWGLERGLGRISLPGRRGTLIAKAVKTA